MNCISEASQFNWFWMVSLLEHLSRASKILSKYNLRKKIKCAGARYLFNSSMRERDHKCGAEKIEESEILITTAERKNAPI